MTRTMGQWVCMALHRTGHRTSDLVAALGSLTLAIFAISHRSFWCQIQAYTVIGLFGIAFALFVRQYKRRMHECATVRSDSYCVDCRSESRASIYVGACMHREASIYESLYPRPVDLWLVVLLWAIWVCYGALFHDGKHVSEENKLLGSATGSLAGEMLPAALRLLRILLFFLASVVSFFASETSGPAHVIVTLALCLFPDAMSTPQALDTGELAVRTFVFVGLFLASEALERVRPYAAFVCTFDKDSSVIVVALQMALRKAPRRSISSQWTSCLRASETSPHEHGSSAEERAEIETRRTAARTFARARSSLRSLWVLVVSPVSFGFALVQVFLVYLIVWYHWSRVHATVRAKSNLLRSSNAPPVPVKKRSAGKTVLPFGKKNDSGDEQPLPPPSQLESGTAVRRASSAPHRERASAHPTSPAASLPKRRKARRAPPVPAKTPTSPAVPRRNAGANGQSASPPIAPPKKAKPAAVPAMNTFDVSLQEAVSIALMSAESKQKKAEKKEPKLQD